MPVFPKRSRAIRRVATASVLGWLCVVGAACSGESRTVEGTPRQSAVVAEIVRALADDVPVEADQLPVVFVVGDEGTVDIEVQAGAAAALVDEVDVRFVDERVEAFDEGLEGSPVRESGVLAVVGPVPEERRFIEVEVYRYVAAEERELLVVSLRWDSPDWTVVSTSIVPPVIDG